MYGTNIKLCSISYRPTYEDGTDRTFQKVGIYTTDAGESPRRRHTKFRTWRNFEIKKKNIVYFFEEDCFGDIDIPQGDSSVKVDLRL
jgi:hypothetical protein